MSRNKTLYGCAELSFKDLMECDNNRDKIELEYYLVKSTKDKLNKVTRLFENSESYGIEVVKKEYLDNEECVEERNELLNITENEENVENILETLKKNKVTPISLEDVMHDLMVEKYYY